MSVKSVIGAALVLCRTWQIITDEAMANLLAGLQFDIGEEKFGKLNNRQNFPIQFFPRVVCILLRGDSSISNLILPYMAVGYFSRVSMDPNHVFILPKVHIFLVFLTKFCELGNL